MSQSYAKQQSLAGGTDDHSLLNNRDLAAQHPEGAITFNNTTGHAHTGADATAVDYSDLANLPSSFVPATHGNEAHSSTFVETTDARLSDARTPLSHGNEAHSSTFVETTDSRLSDARTPTSHGNEAHSATFVETTDSRLADARTPTAHASSHNSGGGDAITTLGANINLVGAALFDQIATPANPAASKNKLYFKSDDKLYKLTSGGAETEVGGGTGVTYGAEPGAVSSSTSGTAGTNDSASRSDHSHDLGAHTHADATSGGTVSYSDLTNKPTIPAAASSEPGSVSSSSSGAVGDATAYARENHSHDLGTHAHTGVTDGGQIAYSSLSGPPSIPAASDTEPGAVSSSTSGGAGVAATFSRSDHAHDLGSHTHADATAGGTVSYTDLTDTPTIPSASAVEPGAVVNSSSGAVGVSADYARADHSHDFTGTSSGASLTATMTAGEVLSEFDVVYGDTSVGKVKKAQSDGTEAEANAIGIVTESGGIANDGTGEITFCGPVTNASWNWTVPGDLFVSATAGALTQTAPVTGYCKPCGFATGATTAYLDFQQPGWAVGGTATPIIDVVGGRMALVSATSIKWGFSTSNQIKTYNPTSQAWEIIQVATEPTLANNATDLNGDALAVDKIHDVFAVYSSGTAVTLACSSWAVSTAGSSARCAAWLTGTAYKVGNRVTNGGHDYVCLVAHSSGTFATDLAAGKWVDNGVSVTGDFAGLYRHEGVLVSDATDSGKSRRWLGTIYTYNNSSVVNFKDEENYRYISNYYNATKRLLKSYNTGTQWTYSTNTVREYNGGSNQIRAQSVSCISQQLIFNTNIKTYKTGTAILVGIGSNSTTVESSPRLVSTMTDNVCTITTPVSLGAGYNWVTQVESANSATLTNFAYNGGDSAAVCLLQG